MYKGVDRRMFERVEGIVVVKYAVSGSPIEHYTATRNISGAGVRISVFNKVMPGSIIELEIFKKDWHLSARCKGAVVWVKESIESGKRCYEAGIKFLDIDLVYIGDLINELKEENLRTFNHITT